MAFNGNVAENDPDEYFENFENSVRLIIHQQELVYKRKYFLISDQYKVDIIIIFYKV